MTRQSSRFFYFLTRTSLLPLRSHLPLKLRLAMSFLLSHIYLLQQSPLPSIEPNLTTTSINNTSFTPVHTTSNYPTNTCSSFSHVLDKPPPKISTNNNPTAPMPTHNPHPTGNPQDLTSQKIKEQPKLHPPKICPTSSTIKHPSTDTFPSVKSPTKTVCSAKTRFRRCP